MLKQIRRLTSTCYTVSAAILYCTCLPIEVHANLFLYNAYVPEGYMAVFENRGTFYKVIHPSGTYSAWPNDVMYLFPTQLTHYEVPYLMCSDKRNNAFFFKDMTILYRIPVNAVLGIAQQYGNNYKDELLQSSLVQVVDSYCSSNTYHYLTNQKEPVIEKTVTTALQQDPTIVESGITIDMVVFSEHLNSVIKHRNETITADASQAEISDAVVEAEPSIKTLDSIITDNQNHLTPVTSELNTSTHAPFFEQNLPRQTEPKRKHPANDTKESILSALDPF